MRESSRATSSASAAENIGVGPAFDDQVAFQLSRALVDKAVGQKVGPVAMVG